MSKEGDTSQNHAAPPIFWRKWLEIATAGTAAFGLSLTLVPGFANAIFGLMIYRDVAGPADAGPEALRYIGFVYAVLGAVMFGWGAMMFLVARHQFARGERRGWMLIALPLMCWFVPDTGYSLLSGYWQNAVLNVGFIVALGVPLIATRSLIRTT